MENIQEVKLTELHPFPDHPFQVKDDEKMQETVGTLYGLVWDTRCCCASPCSRPAL